jgi:hypothetical protein
MANWLARLRQRRTEKRESRAAMLGETVKGVTLWVTISAHLGLRLAKGAAAPIAHDARRRPYQSHRLERHDRCVPKRGDIRTALASVAMVGGRARPAPPRFHHVASGERGVAGAAGQAAAAVRGASGGSARSGPANFMPRAPRTREVAPASDPTAHPKCPCAPTDSGSRYTLGQQTMLPFASPARAPPANALAHGMRWCEVTNELLRGRG